MLSSAINEQGRIAFYAFTIIILAGGVTMYVLLLASGSPVHPNTRWIEPWIVANSSSNTFPYRSSSWTMYDYCFTANIGTRGVNRYCSPSSAAYPFDPRTNGGHFFSTDQVYDDFLNTDKYFYMSRFQYPFYILAVISLGIAFLASFFILWFYIAGIITCSCSAVATLFGLLAASLSTGTYVQAAKVFRDHGDSAEVSHILMGLAWTNVVIGLICTLFSLLSIPPALIPKKNARRDSELGRVESYIDKDDFSIEARE